MKLILKQNKRDNDHDHIACGNIPGSQVLDFLHPPLIFPLRRDHSQLLRDGKLFGFLSHRVRFRPCSLETIFERHQIRNSLSTQPITLPSSNSTRHTENPLNCTSRCRSRQNISRHLTEIRIQCCIGLPPAQTGYNGCIVCDLNIAIKLVAASFGSATGKQCLKLEILVAGVMFVLLMLRGSIG